jgi:hypothetical protein
MYARNCFDNYRVEAMTQLEALRAMQKDAQLKNLPTPFTSEMRRAIAGEGPRAYDWSDKPHRLVYDLCAELERIAALEAASTDGEGWVRVPREPTEAMCLAWTNSKPYDGDYTDDKCATACWKDMVAAALASTPRVSTWYDTNEPDSLDERGPHD